MIATVLRALLSHWRRRPLEAITLLIGIALATALWTGVQAINAEARASYAEAATTLDQADRATLINPNGTIPLAQYARLRRSGWLVTPIIEGTAQAGETQVQILGVDLLATPVAPTETNQSTLTADAFTSEGMVFAHPDTVEALDGAGLPPIRAAQNLTPGTLLADIPTAQRLLGREDGFDRLIILDSQPLLQATLADIAPNLVLTEPETATDLARLTDSFHLNLTAFGLLSFAVGFFIVNGTIGLAFEQRRPMIRTIRAVGTPLRLLIILISAELLTFALIGATIGVALGYALAALLLPDVAATLRGLYGANISGSLAIRPDWWLSGFAIAILGTGAASASALWKLHRMPLLAPAQPRAWARMTGWARLGQAALALGTLALGLLVFTLGDGLVAGFALLGGLLMAFAFALPLVLSLILAGFTRLTKAPLLAWFWADTRDQLPGLSLALMALLLALAANVGVGTMVLSFRLTFTGWLDQRLASELYIRAENETQAQDIRTWLEPRADAVLPIWNIETTLFGRPADVFGIIDHATYRENWPLLEEAPTPWDSIQAGTGLLINEQTARREDLSLGDPITIAAGWTLPIVGIYSDYGNPSGQIIVSLDDLLARYPDVQKLRYGIRIALDEKEAIRNELTQSFGLTGEQLIDQDALKGQALRVFDRTFAVSAALNVLTLTIAGISMLTSLLTLANMRLPQLAPVWALGMTRRKLALLELARSLFLALLTMICAIPVGLALAWCLLAIINVEAFGWRLPMHIFPDDWIRLAGLTLVAATAAAAWPAFRLAKIPPSRLLRVFADER